MTKTMRRNLKFDCLGQAVEESETLLRHGYEKTGNWSLGQMCCHLRLTIEKNMNGYPGWMVVSGYPFRPVLRMFVLPKLLNGQSPRGFPTAGIFVPPGEVDDSNEVEQFRNCATHFLESNAPLHAHPGFGKMSKEAFNQFHAAHAAHHLGFLHYSHRP